MSDVITKPGFYKTQSGGKAEVVFQRGHWWYGCDVLPTGEDSARRWDSNGACQTTRDPHDSIVSPWPPNQPPKPFTISEHGPGVYETRDGREAVVAGGREESQFHVWKGLFSYGDNGGLFSDGSTSKDDLVRYLRPLPKPAVDPGEGWRLLGIGERVIAGDEALQCGRWFQRQLLGDVISKTHYPHRRRVVAKPAEQPEWTPTNGLRLAKTAFDDPTGTWYGKGADSQWLRLEQRWTNGTDSEWRPVTVEGA